MQPVLGSEHHKSGPLAPCALWPVDLKLTHLDWNPESILIHFQGQYLTICELDYDILQREIQNAPKTKAAVDIGESCLVEDFTSAHWYRGRVQNRKEDLFDVFLIDHGNVLSVDITNISSCSNDLFILPPKIVCGFVANVLLLQGCDNDNNSAVDDYFSNLIGKNVTGYIQALLPHKVLLLETPEVNIDLVRHGFARHVDTDTFLLLVEMLTEVPLKQNIEPVPDLLIEKPRGQEFCFKPSGLHGYKDILSFCGPRFSCGTHAKVRVTAAINPELFYCQMASRETDLREMSKKLAAVCEYRTKECNQKTAENLGLLCSVKGKDGKWYRGFVQFLPVNAQVRVLFIDYGFFESVKVENVHKLPSDFDKTPIMAFPCSLFSPSDQDEAAKAQQLSFLKEGLLGRVLDVEFRSFDKEQHLHSIKIIGAEENHMKELKPIQELPKIKVESVGETEQLASKGGYLYHNTIMCEALGKTLEAEEVQVDSVFVGYVEHVQNPNHFWMRTQKRNDDFEEMMANMADHFWQVKLDEDVLLNPEIGKLCCAVYEEDMHFYRGVVMDTLDHGAEVLFVDFGNIEKVAHMLIKNIPETFASKPPFAFCCSLVNVLPLGEVWTSATCNFFRRAVTNKTLLVHIVQIRKNKFVVDLREMGNGSGHSITELLIASKQAEYWNSIPKELMVQNNTDVTEQTRCQRYNLASDINGNPEQLENYHEEEKRCTKETERAPARFKALCLKPGCEFAVSCSCINSPSDFWCQRLDKIRAMEELMDKVQLYYSTHTVALEPGDSCCVAKSPQDGRWYRAFITEKQKDHTKVMLVDYGNTFQLKEHNLQAIIPEYLSLEGQAFRCSLYNLIEPADSTDCGSWSPEACNSLKGFVRNSIHGLRCKVVSQLNVKNKGLCNVVDLFNTQTQQNITNLLMKQSLAREVTVSMKQDIAVFPESFVFSSYDLTPGHEEQVYVTHVNSQCEIYCHLERNFDIIEQLEKKISEESNNMMQASTRAVVRKLCLAKYLDGKWYRGIVHPVHSPLHLSVFFVDYGNTSISENTHIMFIPRDSVDLLYTPMQAVRCSLSSVPKEELYADVKEWLDDAVLNKQVRALIVGKSEDGSFDVELFDGAVNINEKVKQLIVGFSPRPKTFGTIDKSSTMTKCKILHTRKTQAFVKYKSQHEGHSLNSPTSNAYKGSSVGSAPSKRKERPKKYVLGKGESIKTKVIQQNQDKTNHGGVPVKSQKTSEVKQEEHPDTKSKTPQHTEETETPQLSCLHTKVTEGFRALCYISHVDSVKSFFLQLSEDEPAILKLVEDLNSGVLRESLKSTASLRINDLVVAEYEEDGALYRSAVKGYEGSSCFKVEFVDYGNSAIVRKEKIYSIPKEYLSQPQFSIPCSLMDTSTYKTDTSFSNAVIEKPLMVEFVRQYGTCWEVKLEILDQGTLEAAVERSIENEDNAPSLSSEAKEEMKTCEKNQMQYGSTEIEKEEVVPSVSSEAEEEMRTCEKNQMQYGSSEIEKEEVVPSVSSEAEEEMRTCEMNQMQYGSSKIEKEEVVPVVSSEIEDQMRACEHLRKEVSESETTVSKGMMPMPSFDTANLILKTPPATPKLKVKTYRHHIKTPTRNKSFSKKKQRKAIKFSGKAESGGADGIMPPIIQSRDTENCTILSVLSNGNFYVRLNRNNELVSQLESGIADNLYECKMVAEEDVKQDLKCLVQVHTDKQWHRAVVQQISQGKCQVLLVDHGITKQIPSCSIRRQCSDLTKIQNLAVLCKSNCSGFSETEKGHKSWSETLKPLIGSEVKLVFVCYSDTDKLWKVEIVINGLFLIRQIVTSLQQNGELIPSLAENGYEETDGKRNEDTSEPQQLVFAPADIDKMYTGFAAAVTTPCEFCVVLEDSLLIMNKLSIMLDDLPGQMSPLPEAHLVPGTCCLLKSDTKNKWCRAEVVHSDATVILNLVDYGHYECIPYENRSKLKTLPTDMMNLPKVTYPCVLRGVKPVGGDGQWTDEAAVFFQQCLYQKDLQIYFREFVSNTHWKVDLLTDDVHVAKELVDTGHASYIDVMFGLRFLEQRPCKATLRRPEDKCVQEEDDRKSEPPVESTDEWHAVVPGRRHCFLM